MERAYQIFMVVGIVLGIRFWMKLGRTDERLIYIYVGSLLGGFLGAKLAYLVAEGFMDLGHPDMWRRLAAGKSILGGLLGGYLGVEITKKVHGYTGATGDWFASLVPVTIFLGRCGCWFQGCCLGQICPESWFTIADRHGNQRWPAVPIEMGFNIVAIITFIWCRKKGFLKGQHFHVYLIAYGIFRLLHETMRETPRVLFGMVSGYQLLSALLVAVGIMGFIKRKRMQLKLA